MFTPRSRYYGVPTDETSDAHGRPVSAVRFPVRSHPLLQGYHRRLEGQRLDHIASYYLKDPTAFWLVCDTNGAVSPDALAARALIGIPRKEG
jgi:hypothetical protein